MENRGVVDERGGSRKDGGVTADDGGIGATLLPVGGGGLNGGEVGSTVLGDLGGVLNGGGCNSVENRGNEGLGVEGGCNTVVDRGDRQTGVGNAESSGVGDVVDLLQLAFGIDVRVSTGDAG